jgi:AraC-like DNA-binding protein
LEKRDTGKEAGKGMRVTTGDPTKGILDFPGRTVALDDVFGHDARTWASEDARATADTEGVDLADRLWRSHVRDAAARDAREPSEATRAAERIIADHSILSVAAAAAAAGMDVRRLQRIFRREVGISPKEVIRRFRLQEAAERLLRSPGLSSSELALEMGYFDQAHFIRDFRAVAGAPPDLYRRRQRVGPES